MEDRRRLAALGAEVSMTQVFEHGCFHGDAHPSNIFVITPEKYGLIDFGLVGYISEREMRYITDFLVHLIRQQTDRLVRDLKSLGIVVPRGREDDVANAYASILRRYYGVTLAQIDTVRLVNELLDVIYRNHMRLPTKYFLVLRGLTTVEGTGRELYPDFNVFEVAEPYVRRMALRRYSPTTLASENIDRAVELADIVGRYPQQLGDVLDELQDTLREVRRLEEIVGQTTRSATRFINRVAAAILLAALVIGAPRVELQPHLFGVPVLSAMMLATAFFLGLWLLFGLYRSGGL